MPAAIGIRFDDELLKRVENFARVEDEDRSTAVRKLILRGYRDWVKANASESYIRGNITLSEAAHRAGLTIWGMMDYLVGKGFKSTYSVEDLMVEAAALAKKGNRSKP